MLMRHADQGLGWCEVFVKSKGQVAALLAARPAIVPRSYRNQPSSQKRKTLPVAEKFGSTGSSFEKLKSCEVSAESCWILNANSGF
jgi:hypothetical protein